jgi:hypothetical protein
MHESHVPSRRNAKEIATNKYQKIENPSKGYRRCSVTFAYQETSQKG